MPVAVALLVVPSASQPVAVGVVIGAPLGAILGTIVAAIYSTLRKPR
jgi:large-conductance mechanosensitive channel